MHVNAGFIHFRDSLFAEVAEPVEHHEISIADLLGPIFDEPSRPVEKGRRCEVLFKSDDAHRISPVL